MSCAWHLKSATHIRMMYNLRPATREDFPAIQGLVRKAKINPTGLDWQRFIVSVTPGGELIGCGQIKPHRDGSRELASIAVVPDWRHQGVASELINHLIQGSPPPLYLTCRASLGPFYERFGFRLINVNQMPAHFKRIHRLARLLKIARFFGEDLLVMKREG